MNAPRFAQMPPPPPRGDGAPHATTVVMVELLPGTYAYVDTYRHGPPILVIDTGQTEIQLALPGDLYRVEDIRMLDQVFAAVADYRSTCVSRVT